MSMASESEEMTSSKGSKIASIAGGSVLLKKGPWTSAEDAILVDYVTKHGEGNWNAVQKHSGLARCGKSCRLRWANHLRPDLKKGAFTPEEERRIIELHAKMGNKWARMAAELPGRTDNEIKNYWNTRIKRRQRAGLPIYPPDICLKTINARNQDEDMSTFSGGSKQHYNILGTNSSEIPAVEFKKLELNQHSYPPAIVDIPASNLLGHGLSVHPSKRLRGTETLFFPGLSANAGDFQLACGPTYFDQSFGISSSAYNQNLASDHPFLGVIHGSHASLNSNSCSSDPSWEKKLELPSLQSQMGSWYSPSSPLQSLESIDTLIQSPLTEHTETSSLSPLNSGLLDAVLYESHTKNNSYQETSDTCRLLGTIYDKNNPCSKIPKTEWEAYRDPISPLGHSSASLYSGSSLDKPQSVETLTGCKVKQEEDMDWLPIQYDESNNNIISRPDLSLASNCLHHQTNYNKSHSVLKEVFGVALFDDFGRDCKNVGSMAPPSRGCAGCSSSWDAMSAV